MGERTIEQIIVHRAFDGIHEDSDICWCGPTIIDSDDCRDGDEIATDADKTDG